MVRYRVGDLGDLNATPLIGDNSFGINNKRQVCGTFQIFGSPGTWHAAVWLLSPDYGLAAGRHDLHVLSGFTPGLSAANDLNDHGQVAGVRGGLGVITGTNPAGQAVVWTLGSPLTFKAIPFLSGGQWNVAYGINDSGPRAAVGVSERIHACGSSDLHFRAPFIAPLNTILPAAYELDPAGDHSRSAAYDVNNHYSGANPGIAGVYRELPLLIPPCAVLIDEEDPCVLTYRDPARWFNGGISFAPELPGTVNQEHVIRGNNDQDWAAGYGYLVGPSLCLPQALFWGSSTTNPPAQGFFNLGALLGEDGSRAEAIRNREVTGRVQVVGRNISLSRAWLWEGFPQLPTPNWTSSNLNDLIYDNSTPGQPDCRSQWTLRFADDINNHGEIVGHGVKFIDPQTHDRAFILIPVTTCYADLDGDGQVNGFDLAILLGSDGPCPVPGFCIADLDCTGEVDGFDLAILNGEWGSCPGFSAGASGPESSSAAESGSEAPIAPTLAEQTQWLIEHGMSGLVPDLLEAWAQISS